ncbi:MAG: hypothetical protein JWN11_1338 [Hyphomicrobiales bacterium]|nr:hypothetical protein [Hyphomicrobiales bacterium]
MSLSKLTSRLAVAVLVSTTLFMSAAAAQDAAKKTVVLVHGAWADGGSWSKVIPLLDRAGLTVIAVHNPLNSLSEDVANTTRVIDDQTGPVILVGHSYGGMVISEAGNNDKVKALVYVAAFAPEPGQSVNAILKPLGAPPPWLAMLHVDAKGYTTWPRKPMAQYFAAGLKPVDQLVVWATQAPTFGGINDQAVGQTVAYSSKPTWSVVSGKDQIIPPQLQLHFADVMKSTVVKVNSGHLPMLATPREVANAIIKAANSVK